MLRYGDWAGLKFRPAGILAIAGAGLLCGACAGTGELSLGGPQALLAGAATSGEKPDPNEGLNDLDKAIVYWAKQSSEKPGDLTASLNYVRNLRAAGRHEHALGVMQQASIYHGNNSEFLGEYGRLALSLGQTALAEKALKAADNPTKPDWRVSAALGTAMAKQGRYGEAIPQFRRALQLKPGEATILNNLAMAYTADGQAAEAEQYLREAAKTAKPGDRVYNNLALVLSLQGKDAEAKQLTSGDAHLRGTMPVQKADAGGGWTTKFAEVR